ncbi:MAG TPA: response regulator [Polyangiaceae bacterium]
MDDEIDSAETLCALLELLGADVRIATDATAALEAVTTYRPSVVVLDIGLPDIDGHEFARSVRRQADAGITLIALTGWSQEEDMRRSKEAGIDHHLVKPLDMSKLEALLTALQTSPTS